LACCGAAAGAACALALICFCRSASACCSALLAFSMAALSSCKAGCVFWSSAAGFCAKARPPVRVIPQIAIPPNPHQQPLLHHNLASQKT